MARRRASGEGSVYFIEKKGLWAGQVTLPDGSRKFKYSKKQGNVKEWLLTVRNDLRHGVLPSNDRITVSEFIESYMETVGKNILRPSTQEMYWSYIRVHINPSLGKIKLKGLSPHHLQTFYSRKIDAGLSKRTVQILHGTIRRMLNQAVSWGLIPKNPCSQVSAPR